MGRMHTARGTRGRYRGFTLTELLVAVVLLGLVAAIGIPAVLGQREAAGDAAAKSLLRSGASAAEAVFAEHETYSALTAATLAEVEPDVRWTAAPGARSAAGQVALTAVGPGAYTLSTTAPSGTVFTYTKDLATQPTVARSCGGTCSW